ncbi:MAG: arginine--tRNA ligase [Gammaproteobacteria bacterium]|nr:arginine--tRNA ligase [Gammaproteobacteria bacterium]MDH5651906.1 arginine--tRNA ligase [Gammaproteobacteria bacterium]
MKAELQNLIGQAIESLQNDGTLPTDIELKIQIDRTRDKSHGDFACNIAMLLAKPAKAKPRDLAAQIVAALPASDIVTNVEIAGPGFINFFLVSDAQLAVVGKILAAGEQFGRSSKGAGKRVQVEFVSANPTGPLHVGHGRGAAYGATVADLLEAVGFDVHREYYVNDAGRQMDILATSVWLRYLGLCGVELEYPGEQDFPSNGYKGDYVWDIAATLHRENGDAMQKSWTEISEDLPADEPSGGDKEEHIDGLINKAKTLLRDDQYRLVFDLGLNYILDDIRDDLEHFGVTYDEWYSERSLTDSGAVMKALERLQASGHAYEKEGAIWFKSSDFGDEKDRVLVRDNGQTTYFASDIAYHMDKMERGFERVIDIWGADHHGYVPRVKAALEALGDDPKKLDVLLVQFAILYRGGEKAQMSTRSGEFVTLRQLRKEVGNDAARFFYVMRKSEQHLDFDLDLAMSQSSDNPMYYIQYAHARVCSMLRKLEEKGLSYDQSNGLNNLAMLDTDHEQAVMSKLDQYAEVVENAALNHEPHQLVHYLRELANDFHSWYNAHKVIIDESDLRDARLALSQAVRQVTANGLKLLGVSAPESM